MPPVALRHHQRQRRGSPTGVEEFKCAPPAPRRAAGSGSLLFTRMWRQWEPEKPPTPRTPLAVRQPWTSSDQPRAPLVRLPPARKQNRVCGRERIAQAAWNFEFDAAARSRLLGERTRAKRGSALGDSQPQFYLAWKADFPVNGRLLHGQRQSASRRGEGPCVSEP
jgi:hypothetical protein